MTVQTNINWSEWDLVRKIDGKPHEIVFHRLTREKKFIKFLRENGPFRLKELTSELMTSLIFSKVGMGLSPLLVIKDGKPAIFMDYKYDVRLLKLSEQSVINRIAPIDPGAIFLVDRLVKNTNRAMRLDHLGWEEMLDGNIKLFSFDNGNTFSHGSGDETLEDDSDLANLEAQYKEQILSQISSSISPTVGEEILRRLKEIDFQEGCDEVQDSINNTLAPTDDEKKYLEERMRRVHTMLVRRLPKLADSVHQWLGLIPPQPFQPPGVIHQTLEITGAQIN